jgi:hypothetical protein
MRIRLLVGKGTATLLSVPIKARSFTSTEIDVAKELIDIGLKDPIQKDYHIYCAVDSRIQAVGDIC